MRPKSRFLPQILVWLLVGWMACLSFGQVFFNAHEDSHQTNTSTAAVLQQLEQHSHTEHDVCSVFHSYLHCVSMANGWLVLVILSLKIKITPRKNIFLRAQGWQSVHFRPPIFGF